MNHGRLRLVSGWRAKQEHCHSRRCLLETPVSLQFRWPIRPEHREQSLRGEDSRVGSAGGRLREGVTSNPKRKRSPDVRLRHLLCPYQPRALA
jgi:hypothetical protein